MRKNKMMRMASGLLVLTLLTTSVISGTFAKYTTTNKASDTARVAKWGVSITASGNLYSDMYNRYDETGENSNKPATVAYGKYEKDLDDATTSKIYKAITVASAEVADNIVAPGTQSSDTGFTFSIDGKPEVTSSVWGTVKARDIYLEEGYTYGVMVPADVTTENYFDLAQSEKLYVKEDSTFTLVEKYEDTDDAKKGIDDSVLKEGDAEKDFYILNMEVAVPKVPNTEGAGRYYPVKYKLTSEQTKNEEDGIPAGITNVDDRGNFTDAGFRAVDIAKLIADSMYADEDSEAAESVAEDKIGKVYSVDYSSDTAASNVYQPNVDLAKDTAGPNLTKEKLTWEWAFEEKIEDPENSGIQIADPDVDAKDTILGNMIAAYKAKAKGEKVETYFVVAAEKVTDEAIKAYTQVQYRAMWGPAYEYTAFLVDKTEPIASLQTYVDIELNVTQVD